MATKTKSVRFSLRLPAKLMRVVKRRAKRHHISLNDVIVQNLLTSYSQRVTP